MRIALVFEYGTLNGGERSMLAVLKRLRGRPPEFVALAPSQGRLGAALCSEGIAHLPLELRDAAGVRLPAAQVQGALRAAIAAASPALVHANSLTMGRLLGAVAPDVPVPCTAHLRDILGLSAAAVADLNRNHCLVAVSRATRDFHAAQGLAPARVQVVYNGVDCGLFRPRPRTGGLRRALRLAEDAFLIGVIGQIALRKGQDVLAEAAVRLGGSLPRLHTVVIGERHSSKPESAEFEKNIVRRFDEAGLGARLHRLGHREDVPSLMNELDLLVHPARQEPLGRVLLEAAASGLPVVATAVGGTPEIFEDGRTARLVPAGDPDGLATAIQELHDDPRKRTRLAQSARQRIETAFPIDRAADALAALWRDCVRAQTF